MNHLGVKMSTFRQKDHYIKDGFRAPFLMGAALYYIFNPLFLCHLSPYITQYRTLCCVISLLGVRNIKNILKPSENMNIKRFIENTDC